MLCNTGRHCDEEKPDSHPYATPNIRRRQASGRGCKVLLAEIDDSLCVIRIRPGGGDIEGTLYLDHKGAHELRSVSEHLY